MTPLQVSCWRGKFLRQSQSGTPSTINLFLPPSQCWKFPQVRQSEADNFGGGPGTFCWFFFNFMFMIWDSSHEDLQLFWLSFKHCPKLTSRARALRVCSPPAAIAVTQAISQTLICKALRIDSPPHAQMNKQRHKTWSFCLKYYILSKSNKIQRQVGDIFHLWQFLLDQIAHGR